MTRLGHGDHNCVALHRSATPSSAQQAVWRTCPSTGQPDAIMAQSGVLSSVAPTLSWMVLPPLMTQALLRGLYSLQILTPPSTPAQSQMYKQRAQAAVIVGYLVYIVYAAFLHGPTNYYELLQVGLEDDTETIRRSFRRLARIHHPDKVGATVQNEAIFLDLRRAHDALVEPVRRTMYDHFGTAAVGSTVAMAQRDTFFLSLQGSLIAYGFGILFLGLPRWWFQGHSPVNYVSRSRGPV